FLRGARPGALRVLCLLGIAGGRLRIRVPVALRRGRRVLLGVVGDVPAAALELNRRRRQQLVHRAAAAARTALDERIGELLNLLEALTARFAFVFVQGHTQSSVGSGQLLASCDL